MTASIEQKLLKTLQQKCARINTLQRTRLTAKNVKNLFNVSISWELLILILRIGIPFCSCAESEFAMADVAVNHIVPSDVVLQLLLLLLQWMWWCF